jgi:hypothetical protein
VDKELPTFDQLVMLWAAIQGYKAQYGECGIGEQHPELPQGCVDRVEAVVNAASDIVDSTTDRIKQNWSNPTYY